MAENNIIFIVSGSERLLRNGHNEPFEQQSRFPVYQEDEPVSCSPTATAAAAASEHIDNGTPAPEYFADEYFLAITTAHRMRDPSLGFVFGRSQDCDILLDDRAISERHIAVKIIWEWKTVVLQNHSKHGTRVDLHHFNEQILLRKTRVFGDEHKADLDLGNGIKLHFRRLEQPRDWDSYCARMSARVPGIGSLQLESMPASSAVSDRRPVYVLGRRLGSGAHAQVFEAVEKYTGALYAVKLYNKTRQARWKEPEILETLQHKHIVRYVAYSRPAGQPAELVMEFVQGVNLQVLLDPGSGGHWPLTRYETRDVLHQLAAALSYLHDAGVTHRDLKPANVMLPQRDPVHVKLVDFGEATDRDQFDTHCGTLLYAAPEVTARRACTSKVDMFSLGIVALQMLYGLPSSGRGQRTTAARWQEAVRGRLVFLTQRGPPSLPLDFVCGLLHEAPARRLSARQSVDHGFFAPGADFGPLAALITNSSPVGDPPTTLYDPVSLLVRSTPAGAAGGADAIPDTATWRQGGGSPPPPPPPLLLNGRTLATTLAGHVSMLDIYAAAATPRVARLRYYYLLRDRGVVNEEAGQQWVPLVDGCFLCQALGLDPAPLLAWAALEPAVLRGNYLLLQQALPTQYAVLWWNDVAVLYAPAEGTVNVTHLARACGAGRRWLAVQLGKHPHIQKTTVRGAQPSQGTYISVEDAFRLCAMEVLDTAPVQAIADACGLSFADASFYAFANSLRESPGAVGDAAEEEQADVHQADHQADDQADDSQANYQADYQEDYQADYQAGYHADDQADDLHVVDPPAELVPPESLGSPDKYYWENIPGSMATPVMTSFWRGDDAADPDPPPEAAAPSEEDADAGRVRHRRRFPLTRVTEGHSLFKYHGKAVVFRPRDRGINITRLLREFGVARSDMHAFFRRHPEVRRLPATTNGGGGGGGGAAVGTYMAAGEDVLQLCRHFRRLDRAAIGAICDAVCAAADEQADEAVVA